MRPCEVKPEWVRLAGDAFDNAPREPGDYALRGPMAAALAAVLPLAVAEEREAAIRDAATYAALRTMPGNDAGPTIWGRFEGERDAVAIAFQKLSAVLRVNMLRWVPGTSHGEIDAAIDACLGPVASRVLSDHIPDAGKMVEPPHVKDCLTTQGAYRAGAEAMRERAAEQVDCGCSWRADALAATNKGERFVACGNDPCGAIEARAIRALPLPAGGAGWRPIETAPIDQEIDVWVARSEDGHAYSHGYRQERVVWNATDQYWEGERTAILPRQVTHWQPLPAAPEEGG